MMFDDYLFKDLTTKINLKLYRNSESVYSNWQMSNFLNNFNTYYYKFELIDTIALALNNGIEPENIVILNGSFNPNTNYPKFDVLDLLDTDLLFLLNIGRPVSLFPNADTYKFSFMIKAYQQVYDVIKRERRAKNIPKELLRNWHSYMDDNGILRYLSDTQDLAFKFTSRLKNDRLDKAIYNKIDQLRQEFLDFEKEIYDIHKVGTLLKSDIDLEDIQDETVRRIYEQYYTQFFKVFSRVSRPVIGIYYDNFTKIKVLCNAHISKKRNVTLLDLKSLTHNSPIGLEYIGGIFVTKVIDAVVNAEKENLEKQVLKAQIDTEREKQKTEQLKQLELKVSIIKQMNNINDNVNIPSNIRNVTNAYLKTQLANSEQKISNQTYALLKSSKFEISDELITQIDVEA